MSSPPPIDQGAGLDDVKLWIQHHGATSAQRWHSQRDWNTHREELEETFRTWFQAIHDDLAKQRVRLALIAGASALIGAAGADFLKVMLNQ